MENKTSFFSFTKDNFWIFEIIFVVVAVLCVDFILKYFIRHIRRKATEKNDWRVHLDYIVLTPLKSILWLIAIYYSISILAVRFEIPLVGGWLVLAKNILIILCVMWLVLRWKNTIFRTFFQSAQKKKKNLDQGSFDFLSRIASVIIVFIALLLILQVFGLNITPLVAFGGIGAAAVGFAAKDVIANFFGGIVIHMTRPFTKGDFINLPSKSIMAVVENVGWYYTLLRDMDKCPIYLPNMAFSASYIMNLSRRTHRKIQEKIQVRYEDFSKLNGIIEAIKKYLNEKDTVDQTMPPYVYFTAFNEYSLDILIRVYTLETRYQQFLEIKQEILMQVKKIIDAAGGDIPFPTTSVKLVQK